MRTDYSADSGAKRCARIPPVNLMPATTSSPSLNGIGSLNEKPLHAALKQHLARPGDRFEVPLDGFVIDIIQDDLLLEIQTKGFTAIKRKLTALTANHKVRLIYPITAEKWIVKIPAKASANANGNGSPKPRKSPKRGQWDDVFAELVAFPKLLAHPNFSLMLLLIREEEVRRHDARRAWRRKGWITHERRLIDIIDHRLYQSPGDMQSFLPRELPEPFTTSDLADTTGRPRWLAQKMAYCLREMGVIVPIGFRNRAVLYVRANESREEASRAGVRSPDRRSDLPLPREH